jgi:copper chaperone
MRADNDMIELKVSGMSCQHCSGAVAKALEAVPGVSQVEVDLETGLARVEGDAAPDALVRAVTGAGYEAALAGPG